MKDKYILMRGYTVEDMHISYEEGAYDDMFFKSEQEARDYARKSLYYLEENEYFELWRVWDGDDDELIDTIEGGLNNDKQY